ncbi:hypothetical protein HY251_03775 [bacterium]|nr:hypothetical protein [bacterium]
MEPPEVVPAEPDDRTLMVLTREPGQRRSALRVLYERHQDELFGFLLHVLRDGSAAEDALQETFVRLATSAERSSGSRTERAPPGH